MMGSVILLAGILMGGNARAAAPADLAASVEKLVRDLDSPELATRQTAEEDLVKLGPQVLDVLPRDVGPGKAEVAQRPARTLTAQRRRLNEWLHHYNHQRPHQALGQRTPASRYRPGHHQPIRLRMPGYPSGWLVRTVKGKGELLVGGRRYGVGRAFAGLRVGLKPLGGSHYHVFFDSLLLGSIDLQQDHSLRPACAHIQS